VPSTRPGLFAVQHLPPNRKAAPRNPRALPARGSSSRPVLIISIFFAAEMVGRGLGPPATMTTGVIAQLMDNARQ